MAKVYEHKKKPKPGSWAGILLTPMVYPTRTVLGPSKEEANEQINKQFSERIFALFEHFEINPENPHALESLIFQLVRKMGIPGFKIIVSGQPFKKVGRETQWDVGGIKLYADVYEIVKKEGCSVRQAILDHLTKRKEYRAHRPASLHARYKETKSALGKEGCKNLEAILECDHPSFYPMARLLITSRSADGTAMFRNLSILESFARMAQKLVNLESGKILQRP